ncbi:MAG: sensor histidine kinase N-terminal domain-containing protein [Gallionellaceae bacterium]|jgi:signal transduction histidine kinase|nr:sensor histidine kinase N-terminal domain-containing protein [Gallionellaceae bacterium]
MLPQHRSILWRIVGLHLIAMLAMAVIIPLSFSMLVNASVTTLQHQTLDQHANAIAASLRRAPGGNWTLELDAGLRALYDTGGGGFVFAVIDANGRLLFGAPTAKAPMLGTLERANERSYFEQKRGKATLSGVSLPEQRGDATVWIVVAQDLEHPDAIVDDVAADFMKSTTLFTVPFLVILFTLDIFIIRRALKPVIAASKVARQIDLRSIDHRLPVEGLPREILPLAEAVNEAIDRLAEGYKTQREFTADAAHELRTPLTILQMQIDALPRSPQSGKLRAGVEHMARIVNQLLEMAELDTTPSRSDMKTTDLHALALEVAADLSPLALAQGKEIALTGEAGPVRVSGSSSLLFRAVRNLVENAIQHTPAGTHIEIRIDRSGELRVIDNGAGIPERERRHVFQRFWRGERSNEGGAGLGLAIAESAARNCGGTIEIESAPGRGAVFLLRTRPVGSQ